MTAPTGKRPLSYRRTMLRLLCGSAPGVALAAVLAGCQSNGAPNDPFLPFMKSRVPPPGTAVPAGGVPVDPYYGAAPPGGAPPAVVAPPPAAPGAVPAPVDKYMPRGGFNVPQGSIDRSKAIDPKDHELRAGGSGTAIARRTLAAPQAGGAQVDTQLTSVRTAASGSSELEPATSSSSDFANATLRMKSATVTDETATHGGASEASAAAAADLAMDAGVTEGASKFRILTSEDESAQAASDPTGSDTIPVAKSGPVWRMRMPGGAPGSQLASRPVESTPDRPATLSVADGQAAVAFRGNQPAATPGVQFADSSEAAPGATVQAGYIAAEGAEAKFVQTSLADVDAAGSATPAAATEQAARGAGSNYGYDPSYNSLRGRLEYSQRAREWKLRYIPIDGSTDQYGGSVVLAESPQLADFKPGDFVNVRGSLSAGGPARGGYSPRFELSQIAPE